MKLHNNDNNEEFKDSAQKKNLISTGNNSIPTPPNRAKIGP